VLPISKIAEVLAVSLARRLAHQAWDDNRPRSADQFMQMADEAVRHVEIVRQIIEIDNIKSAFKPDDLSPIELPDSTALS